jgi:hypothetical protein
VEPGDGELQVVGLPERGDAILDIGRVGVDGRLQGGKVLGPGGAAGTDRR